MTRPRASLGRVLVFELSRAAHLPSYAGYLARFWSRHDPEGNLIFLTAHPDLRALAQVAPHRNVHFVSISPEEREQRALMEPAVDLATRLRGGRESNDSLLYDCELLSRYSQQLQATRNFLLHADPYMPLLERMCRPFSGLYFGATFHYSKLFGPDSIPASRVLRDKFLLARALRCAHLEKLYMLDPLAAEQARLFPNPEKTGYLPDPIETAQAEPAQLSSLRSELQIAPGRRVLLIFGHLSLRKGIEALLEAIPQLPPELSKRLCLLVVGSIHPDYRQQLEAAIQVTASSAPVQIVTRYRFVAQAEVPAYFRLAHAVLVPYLHHVGMSGVLLLAAASKKPVLSTGSGVLGQIVRRYRLGLTVATSPAELREGLRRILTEPRELLCDLAGMRKLVAEHHPDAFCRGVLGYPEGDKDRSAASSGSKHFSQS